MATKFSQFTTGVAPVDATTFLVGYESVANTNNQYSKTDIVGWLTSGSGAISTLYTADGTIGTTRKALITDTIQFRNAGDTSDILSLNSDGKFALGDGAICTVNTNVSIGKGADDGGSASYGNNVVIGSSATAAHKSLVAIGASANVTGAQGIAIGKDCIAAGSGIGIGHFVGAGTNSVAVGESAGRPFPGGTANTINIGSLSQGTGANSMTFNVNGTAAAPTTANTFGVYMSSNTTPDFRISHDGDSYITGSGKFGIGRSNITATLDVTHYDATRKLASFSDNSQTEVFSIANNGTVKITGQAYTELHDTTNTTLTVDWDNSNIQELTSLTGSLTFTASNPKAGATYILTLAQTGTVTATWTGVKWPAATAPTLSGAGKTDVVTLICYDAAANSGAGAYYGSSVLNFTT